MTKERKKGEGDVAEKDNINLNVQILETSN